MTTAPLVFGLAVGFALFLFVSMTSFVKLSVVFMIIRQALGMQQVPSNMILMALAVFISAFVAKPVFVQAVAAASDLAGALETPQDYLNVAVAAITPFQRFIGLNTEPEHIDFLMEVADEVWRGSGVSASNGDLMIQIPAFLLSELTEAFRIGFLLYLPFVAIDLAITGILMALGMQMVQPNIIAVPFKLLTFVFVDGWGRLIEGLILTYTD